MIYFVLDQQSKAIKIGFSGNPEERLIQLQVSSPNPLFILSVIEGDEEAEKNLHIRFNRYRINGEWFEASTELLWFVRRVTWGQEETKETYRRRWSTPESQNSTDQTVGKRVHTAVNLLTTLFAQSSEWNRDDLFATASQEGLSKMAVYEAKEKLGIQAKWVGRTMVWKMAPEVTEAN